MNLLEWSATLFDWQQDALRRLSLNLDLSEEDRAAIMERLKHARPKPSPAALRKRIESAYLALTDGRKNETVRLARLRAELSDLDRATVDAALPRERFSPLARLRRAVEHQECLLIGVHRKALAGGPSNAIDPERTRPALRLI